MEEPTDVRLNLESSADAASNNHTFPVFKARGTFTLTGSVPVRCSMQNTKIQVHFKLFTPDGNVQEEGSLSEMLLLCEETFSLSATKRSFTHRFTAHCKDSFVQVEVNCDGKRLVALNQIVLDLNLKQNTCHFHHDNSTAEDQQEEFSFLANHNDIEIERRENSAHFLVLSHGNNGTDLDMFYMSERIRFLFEKKCPNVDFFILCVRSNSSDTWNGIHVGGERISNEVTEFYLKYLTRYDHIYLSLVGHSLGGLYMRFAAPLILDHEVLVNRVIPVSYMSISTPHLGARKPSGSSWLHKGLKAGAELYMKHIIGETGKQLCLEDSGYGGRKEPILLQMSEPDSKFIHALRKFKYCTLSGATHFDMIVPHATSMISYSHSYTEPLFRNQLSFAVVGHSRFFDTHTTNTDTYYHRLLPLDKCIDNEPDASDMLVQASERKFLSDQAQEIEFIPSIMHNLQYHSNVQWRRIHLQFEIMNKLEVFNGTAHGIVINKASPVPISTKGDSPAASSCVKILSSVLLIDHMTQ